MPSRTVTFLSREWLPYMGGPKKLLLRYSVVNTDLIGQADETTHTHEYSVVVKVSRAIENSWKMEGPNLEKVLFEYAKRHVAAKIKDDSLAQHEEIDLNTYSAPKACPYEPDRITIALGDPFEFQVERPFGFRAKQN